MKIFGIGIDVVEVNRISLILNKKNNFKKRIFSNKEISQSKNTKKIYHFFAKRFAAKEAFSKALGTGISKGINFNEIAVLNEKNGKPFLKLEGQTKQTVKKKLKKKTIISLSISDEKKYAVAFVTISL